MNERAVSSFRAGMDLAVATPAEQDPAGRGLLARVVIPNLGGVVALMLLPLVWLGLPWVSWIAATSAWAINRIGHVVTMGLVRDMPQTLAVGAAGIGMMLRIWIIAFGLVMIGADITIGELHIGAGNRGAAMGAMVLFLILFTVDVGIRIFGELRRRATALEPEIPAQEPPTA